VAQNLAKTTFNRNNPYVRLLYSQLRPLMDAELDEQQLIIQMLREYLASATVGSGPLGDSFQIVPTGVANTLDVLPGFGYDRGVFVRKLDRVNITGLTTPIGNRTDYVYMEWWYEEVDAIADPNIIVPPLAIETATRQALRVEFHVSEGVPIAVSPLGHNRVRIGSLNRLAGNSMITAGMIVDERTNWRDTYVSEGGLVEESTPTTVDVGAGRATVGGTVVTWIDTNLAVPAVDGLYYVFVDNTGTLTVDGSLPVDEWDLPFAVVSVSGSVIDVITDIRLQDPILTSIRTEVEDARGTQPSLDTRISLEHNPDGSHNVSIAFPDSIDRDNWISLRPHERTIPQDEIEINAGRYTVPSGLSTFDYPGGFSPSFNPGHPTLDRIDFVGIDEFGVVAIIEGAPAALPLSPPYPDTLIPIAEVTIAADPLANPPVITDSEIRDVRPFLNLGHTSSGGGPSLYELIVLPSPKYVGNIFTLDGSFTPGNNSLMVFRNGKLLESGIDYVEIGTNQVQIIGVVPVATDEFLFLVPLPDIGTGSPPRLYERQYGSDSVPSPPGSSLFTLLNGYYSPNLNNPSLMVFRNGKLLNNTEFLQTSPAQVTLNGFLADPNDIFLFIAYVASSTIADCSATCDAGTFIGTGNPNGNITGQFAQEYFDQTTSTFYKCISYPSGTSWLAI